MLFNKESLERNEIRNEFISGFCYFAPEAYSFKEDCETPLPWACPWLWDEGFEYEAESAYEAGRLHADKYFDAIEDELINAATENGIFRFTDTDDLDAYFNIPENYENFDNTFDYLKHENIKYEIDYDMNGNISEILVYMPENFNCFI